MLSINREFSSIIGSFSISFDLDQGEALWLQGENGIGKSTLFNLLKEEIIEVSFCDQEPLQAMPYYLVEDIFEIIEESSDHFDKKNAKIILDLFGLSRIFKKQYSVLSGGEEQVLKIALCFSFDSLFYFLDEPFQFLDSKRKEVLLRILKKMKDEKKGFFIIDHLNFYEGFFDKIGVLVKSQGTRHIEWNS